jgi:hypothetical protein
MAVYDFSWAKLAPKKLDPFKSEKQSNLAILAPIFFADEHSELQRISLTLGWATKVMVLHQTTSH